MIYTCMLTEGEDGMVVHAEQVEGVVDINGNMMPPSTMIYLGSEYTLQRELSPGVFVYHEEPNDLLAD